ncbi:isoprenyl transferase [Hydrogenophilus thermoluteolus]|uniref:polyprenyl diphosphate synthase n=1 Tax=Hydrogenophilus thermoluteolus TaxID=297 RepID=UPI0024A2F45E|nr:polyprenyl diphosphate synthase [Hydrogenophilus thermoluteolus]GLW60167.1 isoprenyl transferase [Hydrogenophilus thermoluteolus]
MRTSSTLAIPDVGEIPRHIAIIMDGNGRWAKARGLPRIEGHRRGVEAVRTVVQHCAELGVEHLTLFAFSSENWRRPPEEVHFLMGLFRLMLKREVARLDKNGIRLRIIGNRDGLSDELRALIEAAETKTACHTKLMLNVAVNYGGRWDLLNAFNRLLSDRPELVGRVSESDLWPYLALGDAPEPDLFIRTGGEQRISNFLIWQLAYTELYFTPVFWPDFDTAALDAAIQWYRERERRFGRTSEQLATTQGRVR